jgi:hypothetical protein
MQVLAQAFAEARFVDAESHEYERINLASGFNVRFCKWSGKPYYITLYLKSRYLFELDLSRIVETKDRFTWYLNRPSHPENLRFLSELLTWEKVPAEYLGKVRLVKTHLSAGVVLPKAGYRLCKQSGRKAMEARFVEVLQRAIATHLPSEREAKDIEYDFDAPEAVEGYERDRLVTAYTRNRSLVKTVQEAGQQHLPGLRLLSFG